MAKGGSKVLTAVIAFLLGFLFAIIVEIGAVFGVYYYVMNTDLEKIMTTVGIKNTDEEGNKKYINTDPDKGGVTNVKELVNGLQGLIYKNGEVLALGKSFDDFSQLVPATDMLLSLVYKTVDPYLEIDRQQFESTPLSGLAQVLSDTVMFAKTAPLVTKIKPDLVGDNGNKIVKALLLGAETEYATVKYNMGILPIEGDDPADSEAPTTAELKFPVLYDFYTRDDFGYSREDFESDQPCGFPANLEENYDLLVPVSKDEEDATGVHERFMLHYVPCRVTESGISEAEYRMSDLTFTEGTGDNAKSYTLSVLEYGEDTDFIVVKPDKEGVFTLDYGAIYGSLNEDAADRSERFTGHSYYVPYAEKYYKTVKDDKTGDRFAIRTISGKNYFRDNSGNTVQLDSLTFNDLLNDTFSPLYSVSISEVVGNDEMVFKIFGKTSLGELMDGKVDLTKTINNLDVGAVIDNVKPDNKLMAYIVYLLSDLTPNGDGTYSAIYDKDGPNEKKVIVSIDNAFIHEVYDAETGEDVPGVKIKDITTLSNNMPVTALMDVRADEAIMAYLGYGVSSLKKAELVEGASPLDPLGNPYDYTAKVRVGEDKKDCYVSTVSKDGNPVITSVWYIEEGQRVFVSGTKVNKVADRVNDFTKDLTIGDVLDLSNSDNRLLKSIADTPIDKLPERIDELTVSDLFSDEDINKNNILSELRNTKIKDLAKELNTLLIQRLYCDEVYRLPKDIKPMEVIGYKPDDGYRYYTVNNLVTDGTNNYTFELVNGDGVLTAEEYANRDTRVFYTYGSDVDADGNPLEGAAMKIVGFSYNESGEMADDFCDNWLFYEKTTEDGTDSYALTSLNVTEDMDETSTDDYTGRLNAGQFESGKYYSYGAARGMWRLVLYKKIDGKDKEKGYTMNNFNNMVTICANNVNLATLTSLKEAGIIQISPEQLELKFYGTNQKLGEMTLAQLIIAVTTLSQSAVTAA